MKRDEAPEKKVEDTKDIEVALSASEEGPELFELELQYFDGSKEEEMLWQARTGLNMDTLCGAIETIVFMSERPISITKIKSIIDQDMPLRVIKDALIRLQEEYEVKHHGIRLLEVAEGLQFRTKATFSKYVQDLFKVNSLVLSPTALEVLAIVAYKQPVSRVEIDKIRGVDSGHIVRGLMDKRLVKLSGRSNEIGRPSVYTTTSEFLEVFNLSDIEQLPPEHELESMLENQKGDISEIKALTQRNQKSSFHFDEIDELDELAREINGISPATAFTQSLKVEEKKRKNESGEEIKTGFDILEEYILKKEIQEQNILAAQSELLNSVIYPQVVRDLLLGPFNTPEVGEDEKFEMIDLDTGTLVKDLKNEDEEKKMPSTPEAVSELVTEKKESDTLALNTAIDKAFATFSERQATTQSQEESSAESDQDLEKKSTEIQDKSDYLDDLSAKIVEKGKTLDMDLNFLEDRSSKDPGFK